MNDFELSPDDPRLTAYALGELEGDERAAVEAAVRRDPELRDAVDEIRATAAQVEAAFAAESLEPGEMQGLPKTNGRAHANGHEPTHGARTGGPVLVTFAAPEEKPRVNGVHKNRRGPPKVLRFPQMYFVAGGLAAACFTIVALRHPTPPAPGANRAKAPFVAGVQAPPAAATDVTARMETDGAPKIGAGPGDAAELAASFVQRPQPAVNLPPPALESRPIEITLPVAVPPVPVVASSAETLAGALLEQAGPNEKTANAPGATATEFAPLTLSSVPLVANPPTSLTVGLPREAALPVLPSTVARGGLPVAGSTSTHAVVRPQEPADAMRLAELRAAGSEAERARLMNEARKNSEAERRALSGLAVRGAAADHPARLMGVSSLRSNGTTGEVRVAFTVDAAGMIQEPRIVRASELMLIDRALGALRAARFEAAAKGGRAVESRLETTIVFRASGEVEIAAPVAAPR